MLHSAVPVLRAWLGCDGGPRLVVMPLVAATGIADICMLHAMMPKKPQTTTPPFLLRKRDLSVCYVCIYMAGTDICSLPRFMFFVCVVSYDCILRYVASYGVLYSYPNIQKDKFPTRTGCMRPSMRTASSLS